MDTKREWWNRPMFTRTLERCNECGELREDVKERVNYWPTIRAVCCSKCFAEMAGEREVVIC